MSDYECNKFCRRYHLYERHKIKRHIQRLQNTSHKAGTKANHLLATANYC